MSIKSKFYLCLQGKDGSTSLEFTKEMNVILMAGMLVRFCSPSCCDGEEIVNSSPPTWDLSSDSIEYVFIVEWLNHTLDEVVKHFTDVGGTELRGCREMYETDTQRSK